MRGLLLSRTHDTSFATDALSLPVCVYIFRHRIVNKMGRAGVEPATPGFSVPCSTS